jgi:hypothetical protein
MRYIVNVEASLLSSQVQHVYTGIDLTVHGRDVMLYAYVGPAKPVRPD